MSDEETFEDDYELPEEPAGRVTAILDRILDELDLDADVEIKESDEEILAEIDGEDDLGILIGRRGQTLDALQLLCYRAAFQGASDRKRVTVDAAGYRERRMVHEVLKDRSDVETYSEGDDPDRRVVVAPLVDGA